MRVYFPPFYVFLCVAHVPLPVPGSIVLPLTIKNFEATISSRPLIMVEFYAPWCGHCKHFAPEYEKAARALKDRVPLAKVDATRETTLRERYNVHSYPSVFLFRDGKPEEFPGERVSDAVVRWVDEQRQPALRIVSSESALQAEIQKRGDKVFFVARGDKELQSVFQKVAITYRSLGAYFYLESQETQAIQVHRGLDEVVQLPKEGILDFALVDDFLHREVVPFFGEYNGGTYPTYIEKSGKGLILACLRPSSFLQDALHHKLLFVEVAKSFPDLPVTYTNASDTSGCDNFPILVVFLGNLTAGEDVSRFSMALTEKNLNSDSLSSWMQAVLNGKVKKDGDEEEDGKVLTGDGDDDSSGVVSRASDDNGSTGVREVAARGNGFLDRSEV